MTFTTPSLIYYLRAVSCPLLRPRSCSCFFISLGPKAKNSCGKARDSSSAMAAYPDLVLCTPFSKSHSGSFPTSRVPEFKKAPRHTWGAVKGSSFCAKLPIHHVASSGKLAAVAVNKMVPPKAAFIPLLILGRCCCCCAAAPEGALGGLTCLRNSRTTWGGNFLSGLALIILLSGFLCK